MNDSSRTSGEPSSSSDLTLERTAELSCHLVHFKTSAPGEVLERLGVELSDHDGARARWSAAIAAELEDGGSSLATRFGAAFVAAKMDLGESKRTVESLGPLHRAAGVHPAAMSAVEAEPEKSDPEAVPAAPPATRVALEVPSYLQPDAATPSPGTVLPRGRPGAVPPRRETLSAPTAPIHLDHVRNMLVRDPTPFRGTTTPERLAELRAASPAPPSEPLPGAEETAMFLPHAAPREHLASLPFAPAPPSAPSASTAPLDLEHLRNMLHRGPTPFAGITTPERLAELRAESPPPASPPPPDADETAMYVPSAAEREELATLPFTPTPAAPASNAPPDVSVEAYAALVAEIQVKKDVIENLARRGITSPRALQALHAEQERRFAADPALRARFEQLRDHFLTFLREGAR